jgi:hypothetical protein
MKLLAVAWFSVFMVSIGVTTNIVQASTRLSFVIDSQPFQYVTVTGDVTELLCSIKAVCFGVKYFFAEKCF